MFWIILKNVSVDRHDVFFIHSRSPKIQHYFSNLSKLQLFGIDFSLEEFQSNFGKLLNKMENLEIVMLDFWGSGMDEEDVMPVYRYIF
jgi:hypothetical protein